MRTYIGYFTFTAALCAAILVAALPGCKATSKHIPAAPAGLSQPGALSTGAPGGSTAGISVPPEGITDVSGLPPRLQRLFDDPIWNAPAPPPAEWDVPPPPEFDIAEAIERAKTLQFLPRNADARTASYKDGQDPGDPAKGQLDPAEAALRFDIGYNGDPDEDGIDNLIERFDGVHPPMVWNLAAVGSAKRTNPQWRANGDNRYAIFQLFGQSSSELIELSYKVPAADPDTDEAYKIEGHNVSLWNLETGLEENGSPVNAWAWYDLFTAAKSNEMPIDNSYTYDDTTGFIQHFEGLISNGAAGVDYDEAYIIRLDTTEFDTIQEDWIDRAKAELLLGSQGNPAVKAMISIPVFGAIAKAYSDLQPAVDGMDNPLPPYTGWLGFPLWQLQDYNGGRPLVDERGVYRLFGQHFFHGFIYWKDYLDSSLNDQVYPYVYNGTTVADKDGSYVRYTTGPIEYGLAGPVGVMAIADDYVPLYSFDVEQSEPVTFYAFAWGGGDGEYSDFLWNFRDGTVAIGQRVQHSFSEVARYSPRCLVINNDDATPPLSAPARSQDYAVFDLPSVSVIYPSVGHGEPRGSACIVNEDENNDDYLAFQDALLALGVDFELIQADPELSDLEPWLEPWSMTFWANSATPGEGTGQEMDFTDRDVQVIKQYCENGGNWITFLANPYYCDGIGRIGAGNDDFEALLGIEAGSEWNGWANGSADFSALTVNYPINQPNLISQIRYSKGPGWYGPNYWHWGTANNYKELVLAPLTFRILDAPHPSGAISGLAHDNNGDDNDGGWAAWIGVEFFTIESTGPYVGTRIDFLENIINFMCPWLFSDLGNWDGYDGEFEIASVTAHAFAPDGTFEGGDGSDGESGFDQYNDGAGTVYHDLTMVPPDDGWVYLSLVIHGPQYGDQADWQIRIDWRDGSPQTIASGDSGIDTYEFRHHYAAGIAPGVNAMTLPGYPGNNPDAIYDGSAGDPLYPDLGELAADAGIPGKPAAISVYAWDGFAGGEYDFLPEETDGTPRHASVWGVKVGIK
ncbi:MAG: hypothetical protein HRF49_07510 [bacterium]|jgi:hypothetical protein